jgi:hypothetical protein
MTKFSEDDPQLTNFLRQNSPIAPIGRSDLEDRIVGAIDAIPIEGDRTRSGSKWRYLSFGIGAIAASTIGWMSYQWLSPQPISMGEIDRLEQYVAEHWQDVVNEPDRPIVQPEEVADLDGDLLLAPDVESEAI